MKIALIQTNPIIGDFAHNCSKILAWLEQAKECGCALAIFPEMAVSGYPPQDLLERAAFLAAHDRAVAALVARVTGIGLICGIISRHTTGSGNPLHNSGVLIADGRLIFSTSKQLLPNYDVFDERRYFEPGREIGVCRFQSLNLALTICEDIWNDEAVFPSRLYAADPVAELLAQAPAPVDLLINIAASPFQLGKTALKHKIFTCLCTKYQLPLAYVNQVGGQDSLVFDGQSLVMDGSGQVVARAKKFAEDLLIFELQERPDPPLAVSDNAPPTSRAVFPAASSAGATDETDDLLQALVLGVRDYVGKCGFSKGLIGLSGGIDSALTAVIACRALGPENVMGIALPSPYTSEASIEDAGTLALNLGIEFKIVPISTIFSGFLDTLEPLFTGLAPDVTEQNLQARIRGTLLMALSNKFGHILLTTGNKSEMAVGYCTLYGDMSGGLAVISDVPKELVYQLAHHINQKKEIIPPRTIQRPPSAELAPDQLDQDDLPPYEILDPILKAYLEEHLSIDEIMARGFSRPIVVDIVRRIRVNEYKRKQAPPGLKVTTKAFGYGRRYPTAQRFREE